MFTLFRTSPTPITEMQEITPNDLPDIGLFEAATKGDADAVKSLLGITLTLRKINTPQSGGRTLLHEAAQRGHSAVVKVLLGNNAQVDARNNKGKTPLMEAAMNGHLDVVTDLITASANVDAADNNGITPLFMVVRSGRLDIVQFLLKKGAKVNANDIEQLLWIALSGRHLDVFTTLLQTFLEKKTEGICEIPGEKRLLKLAAEQGAPDIVKALLAANPNLAASYLAPLHAAVELRNVEVVRVLLTAATGHAATKAKVSSDVSPLLFSVFWSSKSRHIF